MVPRNRNSQQGVGMISSQQSWAFFLLEFEHAVKPHTLTILTAGAILASDSPQGGGGHFMAPHTARMYFNCTAQYTMAKWHI